MNITVTAEEPKDSKLVATLTIPAADVDRAIAKAYRTIANRYNFQGFRKGKAPRPVIDSMVGRMSVLADATNELLAQAEPQMLNELDVVPVGEVSYGEDLNPAEEHQDFVVEATINLRPEAELSSYDPVTINMPPQEVTDAEIDEQTDVLMGYHTHFDDVTDDRGAEGEDFVQCSIESVENGDNFAGDERMLPMGAGMLPEGLEEGLKGMKVGDTKEIAFTQGEGDDEQQVTLKVTVKGLREKHIPELTDEFCSDAFGFDDVAAFREAISEEIAKDKEQHLPALKEDRVVTELTKRLELDEVPADYIEQIYTEIAQQFVRDLQAQGQTVDSFLQLRHITMNQLLEDMRTQAAEHARQSLALDALASHLDIQVTEDDVRSEIAEAGVEDIDGTIASFTKDGQLPAIRETIKRSKAVQWLLENAQVNEVDEVAERRAERDAQ